MNTKEMIIECMPITMSRDEVLCSAHKLPTIDTPPPPPPIIAYNCSFCYSLVTAQYLPCRRERDILWAGAIVFVTTNASQNIMRHENIPV